jgi:hypothetical protein
MWGDLSRRFHGVLFLATPHRDTDDRQMLSGMLQSCGTSASIKDSHEPEPNTSVLQDIQNSFFTCAQDLRIYSIYGSVDKLVDGKRATLSMFSFTLPLTNKGLTEAQAPIKIPSGSTRIILLSPNSKARQIQAIYKSGT